MSDINSHASTALCVVSLLATGSHFQMAVNGEVVSELLDLSLGIVRECMETACDTRIPLEIRQLIMGAFEYSLGG